MPLLLDVAVAAVVVLAALRGWRYGGLAVTVRVVAAVAGLVAGLWLAGLLSDALSPVAHVALGLLCVVGGVLAGAALGRRALRASVSTRPPSVVGRGVGAVLRGGLAAIGCGVALAVAAALGPPSWAATIGSVALAPGSPADVPVAGRVWTGLADVVRSTTPDDLAALVPATTLAGPPDATIGAVDGAVAGSVVAIAASACGRGVTGTGFVAGGSGLLVTNAHVVAGATSVSAGDAPATVVAVDYRTDLAVLRVPDLDAAPLPLATSDAPNGAGLVIVGYPDGGPRTAIGATVVQRMPVPNPGFAGGAALHQAYRLRAAIHHGNSGSPLLDPSGRVVGVVNALAGGDGTQAYAISVDELRPLLATAADRTAAVGTGACRTSS